MLLTSTQSFQSLLQTVMNISNYYFKLQISFDHFIRAYRLSKIWESKFLHYIYPHGISWVKVVLVLVLLESN
jgi:hypothetical protein